MPRTFRPSITMTLWFLAIAVLALCVTSLRIVPMRAWSRAICILALRRLLDPW
jgi:hypothetical protein